MSAAGTWNWNVTDRWYRFRKAPKVFEHVTGIYKLVLAGFEKHVPLEDRHVPTSAVSPSGLWSEELSARLPIGRWRGDRPSMLSHVPGAQRTMVWQLAKSQTPGTTRTGSGCPRGSTTGTRHTTPAPTSRPTKARD
jgi:hypothetical protein